MVYPEYVQLKSKFDFAQEKHARLLEQKEKIFTDTLPSGIRYDKDVVQVTPSCPLDKYVEELERTEKEISKNRDSLKDWEILLTFKERELRKSKEIPDMIFVLKYLEGVSSGRIPSLVNYSKRQTYRILDKIEKTVAKMAQNGTKCHF